MQKFMKKYAILSDDSGTLCNLHFTCAILTLCKNFMHIILIVVAMPVNHVKYGTLSFNP